MKIFLGADHAGFDLKQDIFAYLAKNNYDVEDVGAKMLDPNDDYPQFAYKAVTKLLGSEDKDSRAILVCGGGQGMCIAANRVRGVRATVVWDAHEAKTTRNDNDSNVLCLPARVLEREPAKAYGIVKTWLSTPFSGAARHRRRLGEIEQIYG